MKPRLHIPVFADIGCRDGLDLERILDGVPIGAEINLIDRNMDNVEKIETKLLDIDTSAKAISVDSYKWPANDVAALEDNTVDYARYVRVFQQCGPGFAKEYDLHYPLTAEETEFEMNEIAEEAYRFLKPGGRILAMDLAWDEQHCDQYNGRLNEYIERYAFKMGNPVACPDAHRRRRRRFAMLVLSVWNSNTSILHPPIRRNFCSGLGYCALCR